jgi:site-specific DNA recombinase
MAQEEASQEPDLDRWISRHEYEAGPTYRVHGLSAYHGQQEAKLREAMADMKARRISVLVVWKSDRLERRGAYELMGLVREARSYGGRIEFVTEPTLNVPSGPVGDMMLAFHGATAHHESLTKSDRIKIKHAALRASGSWASGKRPYGYKIVTQADGRKILAPDEYEAPVVARIFEMAAPNECLTVAHVHPRNVSLP